MIYNSYLVTGGAGFIGSHLVETLVKKGVRVFVLDLFSPIPSYFSIQKLERKATFVKADVSDFEKINSIIKKYKIDCIFHLAAQALVEKAYKDPKTTLTTNIIGTVNILESARVNRHVKAVIVASSDKAYGKQLEEKGEQQYSETDPLHGDHPYEVSKSCADLIAQTYHKTYGLPVAIARFGNVYGGGDLNFNRIIPGIMEALIKHKTFEIRSNGRYVRDYVYVADVVRGYLLMAKNINKIKGEAFNFGARDSYSVLELIKLIELNLHKKLKYKILNTAQNEIPYQSLDWSKIRKTLGWEPRYSISQTTKQIFEWYKTRVSRHPDRFLR